MAEDWIENWPCFGPHCGPYCYYFDGRWRFYGAPAVFLHTPVAVIKFWCVLNDGAVLEVIAAPDGRTSATTRRGGKVWLRETPI